MKDVLELALEALKAYRDHGSNDELENAGYIGDRAITALEQAIEQRGEPIGIVNNACTGGIKWIRDDLPQKTPLYTSVPTKDAGTSPSVPEGWQLVPKEPTPEMVEIGATYRLDGFSCTGIYKVMLSVAPEYKE